MLIFWSERLILFQRSYEHLLSLHLTVSLGPGSYRPARTPGRRRGTWTHKVHADVESRSSGSKFTAFSSPSLPFPIFCVEVCIAYHPPSKNTYLRALWWIHSGTIPITIYLKTFLSPPKGTLCLMYKGTSPINVKISLSSEEKGGWRWVGAVRDYPRRLRLCHGLATWVPFLPYSGFWFHSKTNKHN